MTIRANPKNHSYSRIKTFARECERLAAYQALAPWESSEAMEMGSQVHDGLERMAHAMLKGCTAHGAAQAMIADPSPGPHEPEAFATYMTRAIEVFEYLRPEPGGIEQWFDNCDGLPVVGKIDLISETCPILDHMGLPVGTEEKRVVIDHKTTKRPSSMKTKRQAQHSIQLALYCLATGCTSAGWLYYLPTGPVRGVIVDFTPEQLAVARRWVEQTINVVDSRWEQARREDGTFDFSVFALAEPGFQWCSEKWCPFWDQCLGKANEND